jgi:hypothetical protein
VTVAVFHNVFDWTAVGTLALALATLILATATLWAVYLTRRSLSQTQEEIALSRREVEEAHRPVIVPLADPRLIRMAGATSMGKPAAQPAVHTTGQLTVPIENIGTGPALRVEASIELLSNKGDLVTSPGKTPRTETAASKWARPSQAHSWFARLESRAGGECFSGFGWRGCRGRRRGSPTRSRFSFRHVPSVEIGAARSLA